VIQHLLGHTSITTALYACGDQEVKALHANTHPRA